MRSWIDSAPLVQRAVVELRRRGYADLDVRFVDEAALPDVAMEAQASFIAVWSVILDNAARACAKVVHIDGFVDTGRDRDDGRACAVFLARDDGIARSLTDPGLLAAARALRDLGGALVLERDDVDGMRVFRVELPCRPTLALEGVLAARGILRDDLPPMRRDDLPAMRAVAPVMRAVEDTTSPGI